MMRKLSLLLGLVFVLSIGVTAQPKNGGFRGVVTDESGQVLSGVEVTVTNVETKMVTRTVTNEKGEYNVEVPAGTYSAGARLKGFLIIIALDRKLEEGKTVPINFRLEIDAPVRSTTPRGRWIPLNSD